MSHVLQNAGVAAVDPLEFARATLCAVSFVATDTARETHTQALSERFERAGIAASMADALERLEFLREAERLEGGYWVPAPVRAVELGLENCLLVGPHPTDELRRHFPSVRRAGAGRVVGRDDASTLPRQALAMWRGSDGRDASTWARSTIGLAMDHFAPSIAADKLESFGTRIGIGKLNEPTWVPPGDAAACTWSGVGLFRAKIGAARYRYFLGQHSGTTFLEGPAVRESLRMQFGLAAIKSRPLTVRIMEMGGAVSIALPSGAPASLRRLLVALCELQPQSFGRIWMCHDPSYLPALLTALQELKCEENYE